jgi:hypothetical protein
MWDKWDFMKKKQSSDAWPEIVFSSSASRISQAILRGVKSG